MIPDVNVLLAAFREEHAQHVQARRFLLDAIADASAQQTFKLLPFVVASFVRLVTNKKLFPIPTSATMAFAFIDALLEHEGVELVELKREWPIFRELCSERDLKANDIPDAWLAAAALACGDTVATFDVGMRRVLPSSRLVILK